MHRRSIEPRNHFNGSADLVGRYGFGQALTDCYQTDTDHLLAPYRPLSMEILSIQHVKYTSIIGLLSVAFIIVIHNFYNLLLCSLSIIGLWSYSYFKRNYWLAGPFYDAWIAALLTTIGYLSSSELSISYVIDKNVLAVNLLTFFSYTNFVLISYLKDITAAKKIFFSGAAPAFGCGQGLSMSKAARDHLKIGFDLTRGQ